MSSSGPDHRLRKGSRLLVQDVRGLPVEVVVERVEEGSIYLDSADLPVVEGEPVILEHRVPGDASYRTRAEVEIDASRQLVLLPVGEWARDNQRSYVRVRTYGIEAVLTQPLEAGQPARPAPAPRCSLLDVSAGGAALRAEPRFEPGSRVICHFELPGESCFALPARVVRVQDPRDGRLRGTVAVEFEGLDDTHRASLLRWVFREETRRRRR